MPTRILYILLFLLLGFRVSAQREILEKGKNHFNLDSNIYYFEQFIANPELTDSLSLIEGYCRLANKYLDQSLYSRAHRILDLLDATPFVKYNSHAKGMVETERGNLNKFEKSYAEALEHYLSAVNKLKEHPNSSYLVKCYIDMAEYFRKIGQYNSGRRYIQEAFKILNSNSYDDINQEIRAYNRAAAIENEGGEKQLFKKYIDITIELALKHNDKYALANSYNELGFMYKNLQEDDTAIALYNEAERIWLEIGADLDAVHAMNNRAMLFAHQNYPIDKTFKEYEKIIQFVKEKEIDYPLKDIYLYLWIESIEFGDTIQAYYHLLNYHDAMLEDTRKLYDTEITNIMEKYENDKVKKDFEEVSGQLSKSEIELEIEKKLNFRMLIFISISVILAAVIAFLAFRLNTSKNKLKTKNEEKDILLKEIHHRVKNNLQIISSLLELQTQKSNDQQTIDVMLEGQNRVKAMALIHKKLYQNENLAQINFQEYTEELCAALYHIYSNEAKDVKIKIETGNISLDIDTAIPLGLIINELVSNSYKYAFEKVDSPILSIKLSSLGNGEYLLKISDNGPGLPRNINLKNPAQLDSLGLMLVYQLSMQLFGKIEYSNLENSCFSITFKDTFARKLTD